MTHPTRPQMRAILTTDTGSEPVTMPYATVNAAPMPVHTA